MSAQAFVIGRTDWLRDNRARGDERMLRSVGRRSSRMSGNMRGVPQVVFKVVGKGGCHGPNGLGAQLDYVLGKADQIIDPEKQFDRMAHLPKEFTKAKAEDWAADWNRKVESGNSMHMVASFPRGTDSEKVAEIMREVCHDLLDQGQSRFKYIAALHTDTEYPHAHIIVNRRNDEGEFFYFARDHEFTYDVFKDKIVDVAATHGIELVNSSRLSRGETAPAAAHAREALRGLEGVLVSHGPAHYKHDPKQKMNYHVTVASKFGEKTLWGKELEGAMSAANPAIGEKVRVKHEGKEAVSIPTKDGRTITVHRNNWAVDTPDRAASAGAGLGPGATASKKSEPKYEKTEADSAEWKRQQVLKHAADYRGLASTLAREFPALARGFAVAAEALEQGKALTKQFISAAQGASLMASDDQMKDESDRLAQTIEQARQDLMGVRDKIDDLPPMARPDMEARYFEALRDMQEAQGIAVDQDMIDSAAGTIYAEQNREMLRVLSKEDLERTLDGTGIDPDEMRERFASDNHMAALETHWIEADARAIAIERGYDMETQEGRDEAFKDVISTYDKVEDEAREIGWDRDQGIGGPPLEFEVDMDEMTVTVKGEAFTDEYGINDDELSEAVQAKISDLQRLGYDRAYIASESLNIEDEAMRDLGRAKWEEDFERGEAEARAGDPDYLGEQAERAFDAGEQNFDNRELTDVAEGREALRSEIEALAEKETLTDQEERRLVQAVNEWVGPDKEQQLGAGNSQILRDFGGPDKQVDLAEKYLRAEQAHGADRTDALEAVGKTRELNELDKQAEHRRELERQHQESRDRGREDGLER